MESRAGISFYSCGYCNFSGCGWRIIFFAQKKTTLHYPPRHKQRQCVGVTTGCPMGGKVSDYGTADFIQHVLYVCRGAMVYNAPEALTKTQTVRVWCLLSLICICYLYMTWQTGSSSSHPEDLHQVSQERQEVINSELEKLVQFLPSSAHSHWVLRVGNMSFNNETLAIRLLWRSDSSGCIMQVLTAFFSFCIFCPSLFIFTDIWMFSLSFLYVYIYISVLGCLYIYIVFVPILKCLCVLSMPLSWLCTFSVIIIMITQLV